MNSRMCLALVAAIGLLTTACGSDAEVNATASPAAAEPAAASSEPIDDEASEPAADATSAPAQSEATADDDAECSGTYTFDSYSGEVEIPRNPETIAVFDLGILTSFSELGIPIDAEDGFASLGTPLPSELQELADTPLSLGTAFEPDLEALNAMEPDLIVVAARSSGLYPDLVDLNIAPVVDLTQFDAEGTDYFDEFARNHRNIGEIFCVQDTVETVLSDLQADIDAVAAAAPAAGDALVLVTTGVEVTAFGPGAFRFGQVYDTYGFISADESLARDETHGEPVSFEFIAEAAPEVIFVVDRAGAIGGEGETAAAILDNALVDATPAGMNDKIYYVDSFNWYVVFNGIPGVRGVAADLAAATAG